MVEVFVFLLLTAGAFLLAGFIGAIIAKYFFGGKDDK